MTEPLSGQNGTDFEPGTPPGFLDKIEELSRELGEFEGDDPATDPASVRLEPVELTEDGSEQLAREVCEILDAHDSAMSPRWERWKDIDNAYDRIPDTERGGQSSTAQMLCSEITRSYANVAFSRLDEGIRGLSPLMEVVVLDDDDPDQETQENAATAKAIEQLFDEWEELDRDVWLSDTIQRNTLSGDAIVRCEWEEVTRRRLYRDKHGQVQEKPVNSGRIKNQVVENADFVAWPLHERKIQDLVVAGHRSKMPSPMFREFAREIEADPKLTEDIIEKSRGGQSEDDHRSERLKANDIEPGLNPMGGDIEVYDLCCFLTVPGENGPTEFRVVVWRPGKKVLGAFKNPLWNRRHPYFQYTYWREVGSFWGSGVGHEILYEQAADSALWMLEIDNAKVTGNNVRLTRAGSPAHDQQDEIGPGMNLVVDDVEKDFKVVALGAPIAAIGNIQERNDFRAMRVTGMTAPSQGFADPTLKSGASPSSISQLLEQAGKKFGKVDRYFRDALNEHYQFMLELLAQYAPPEFLYHRLSEAKAAAAERIKFVTPTGDVTSQFRIRARSASATSNRDLHKTHLMMYYRLAVEHMTVASQAGAVLAQTNPAGYQRFIEETFAYVHSLFLMIGELQDLPNLKRKRPEIPETTEPDQIINQLQQQLQQVNEQAQMQAAQLQQMMGQPQGQAAPGAPS